MSFPFTPEQIAVFNSAFRDIAEAIERGEKANKDAKFVSFVSSFEGSKASSENRKSKQDEHHEPKEGFSFFQWLGKKKKIEPPATTGATAPAFIPAPVSAKKTADTIPSLFHFQSTDTRVAGRFIAELPWAGHGVDNEIKTEVASVASARAEEKIETEIAAIHGDNRMANLFFSALPWNSNGAESIDTLASAMGSSAVASDISTARFPSSPPQETITDVSSLNTSPANPFFSDLPWQNNDEYTFEISLGLDIEPVSEISQTSGLRESKAVIQPDYTQQKVESANAFFSHLPWEINPSNQEAGNNIPSTPVIPSVFSRESASASLTGAISVTEEDYVENAVLSSQEFFSQLPWLRPDISTGIGSAQCASVGQNPQSILSEDATLLRTDLPFGSFFQALPWQGAIKLEQKTERAGNQGIADSEAVGFFALATQSAIRASQKVPVIDFSETQPKTESYFKTLPWQGVSAK